ncbi:MAG: RHS repeat domain-containing protein [Fimbriimonadaceae bacterium]
MSATWTYDNLNRMSASPGVSYTHDMVGNRLTKVVGSASTTYGWDAVNRMVEVGPTQGSRNNYTYRADGMRVKKVGGGVTTRSYYDGQMPVEEDSAGTVTRNFVGARGIEAMFTTANNATTAAYPLYDTHGNMTATLSLTGSGTGWNIANERSYDVWGSVRSGAATGGPKGRYVANLGHVQDDESGLIYMRARYYEPGTGRFVTEDPECDGKNWYIYVNNKPNIDTDFTGKFADGGFLEGEEFDIQRAEQAVEKMGWAKAKIESIFGSVKNATGVSRAQFREIIHAFKADMDLGAADSVWIHFSDGRIGVLGGDGVMESWTFAEWVRLFFP